MRACYATIFSKLAQEKFDSFIYADHKIGKQIAKAIDRLAANPELGEFLKGEWEGYRRYRMGDYRIVYRIEHGRLVIYILTIDDRKDVYR